MLHACVWRTSANARLPCLGPIIPNKAWKLDLSYTDWCKVAPFTFAFTPQQNLTRPIKIVTHPYSSAFIMCNSCLSKSHLFTYTSLLLHNISPFFPCQHLPAREISQLNFWGVISYQETVSKTTVKLFETGIHLSVNVFPWGWHHFCMYWSIPLGMTLTFWKQNTG